MELEEKGIERACETALCTELEQWRNPGLTVLLEILDASSYEIYFNTKFVLPIYFISVFIVPLLF